MNRHSSVILALTTTLLLLNTAIAQEIIKDKPTPSRAEGAPLSYAYGRDYSTSDVTKVVVIGAFGASSYRAPRPNFGEDALQQAISCFKMLISLSVTST